MEEKNGKKRLMEIVATTSAVDRPNADRCNTALSCQYCSSLSTDLMYDRLNFATFYSKSFYFFAIQNFKWKYCLMFLIICVKSAD